MAYTYDELNNKTVAELQVIYREVDPEPYRVTKKRKSELIRAILNAQKNIHEDEYEGEYQGVVDNYEYEYDYRYEYGDEDESVEDEDEHEAAEDINGISGRFSRINIDGVETSVVKIVSGFTTREMSLAGQTLSKVIDFVRPIIHVSESAPVLVNGVTIIDPDTYVLKANDVVEFVKTAGSKG